MSASFKVSSSTGEYGVTVGCGLFAGTLGQFAEARWIADEFFRARWTGGGSAPLFVEASETEKSLDRAPAMIEALRAGGVNRQSRLVALGGGVIQDISAFVASVYMRGLRWSYVPTTVLAMVDSCIGGKSSINVGPYKNLVGTFHPPQEIYIDPALAETLPRNQFASGLIEAAKICFCRGGEAFARYLASGPATTMSTAGLEEVIVTSLLAKKHFIEIDEFDKKERLLLNFGHTFGHAIEGASNYGIPHGIAVGLGILCAFAFQRQRGMDFAGARQVEAFERHLESMTEQLPGLQAALLRLDLDEVLERFGSDKKHTTDAFTLILVSAAGDVMLEQVAKNEETKRLVRRAIEMTIESYTR